MTRILRLSAYLLGLLLAVGAATAQPTINVLGQFLIVDGIVTKNGAIVKIIGPGGYRYRQNFAPGERININLMDAINAFSTDAEEAVLQPGIYTYEVISRPGGRRVAGNFRFGETPHIEQGAPTQRRLDPQAEEPDPRVTTVDDYVNVVDAGNDGSTAVSLQADGSPRMGVVNHAGVFSIRQHSSTITGNVGTTLVSVKADSTATGDGALGIGTSAPVQSLEIIHNNPVIMLEDSDGGTNWKLGNADGEFLISRGDGGVNVVVISDGSAEESLVIDATGVTLSSSRAVKKNIEPAASEALLEQLAGLPIYTWSYVRDDSDTMHVGPMSEDVHERFGLGVDKTRISPLDTSGLALAGVQALQQALQQELDKRDAEIAELKAAIARLLAEEP